MFDSWQAMYPGIELSADDLEMTRILHGCWVEFVQSAQPGCSSVPEWRPYDVETDMLMEFGAEPSQRTSFRRRQLDAIEASMAWVIAQQRALIEAFTSAGETH